MISFSAANSRLGNLESRRALDWRDAIHVKKAIDRSPFSPGPPEAGAFASRLGHWPSRMALKAARHRTSAAILLGHWPSAGSMAARAQASAASSSRRLFVLAVLGGSNRQRKERAIGKFEIPAGHLYLTFPAWFAFDHELGADRKPTGKAV